MVKMTNINPYNKGIGYPALPTGPHGASGGGQILLGPHGTPKSYQYLPPVMDMPAMPPLAMPMMRLVLKGRSLIPNVARSTRMRDLGTQGLLNDGMEELDAIGVKTKGTVDILDIAGFTHQSTCANSPLSGLWRGRSSGGTQVCGNGHAPQQDFGTALAEATSAIGARGTLMQLTTLDEVPGFTDGKRRRHYYLEDSNNSGRGLRPLLARRRNTLTATKSQMDTSRRTRKVPRGVPYRQPAIQMTASEGGKGEIVLSKPVKVDHRLVPTKSEKKTFPKLGMALLGAYHKLTEINDLVDSLADAIPGGKCSNMPGFRKLVCVVNNYDEIDGMEALKNILINELEDKLVGTAQGKLKNALQNAGGPNATQVNQFLRQLKLLTQGVV